MTVSHACPPARRDDTAELLHGVTVPDPYRWLEDLDAPATRAWIDAQNALTGAFLAEVPERVRIRERLAALWDYERFGVPVQRGGRYFFTRNDGLQNQAVLYWLDRLDGESRLLLDPNALATDGTIALLDFVPSEDGRLLAYALSSGGSDWLEWRVRDIASGRDLDDCLQWVKFSRVAWTHDGQGFFYSRYAAPADGLAYKGVNDNQQLCYHRLGAPQPDDVVVYRRPDEPEWGFDARVTHDGRYLVLHVWHGTHRENDLFYRDLGTPDAPMVELLTGFTAAYSFVGNDGPLFYLETDDGAPRKRLIAVDLARPAREHWREVLAESADALQAVTYVGGRFVAVYLQDAHSRAAVYERDGRAVRTVALPGLGSVLGFDGRPDDPETFFLFTGFAAPGAVYRYDVATGAVTVFREPRAGFNSADYVTEQVFYPSKDGTRIPLFLCYKRGLARDGNARTLLYGYGGFNVPLPPAFSVANLVWMEMGGIYAQACLRGGGEYGNEWHDAGRLAHKQNVFDDFIAAGEWLIANGYTRRERLAILGRSNGGLLVGACLIQRPDLFGACVAGVGVLDMLRFHRFTIGWGWVSDYGSPDDPAMFPVLRAYSPYHNLQPGTAYPPTLITTGDYDDRVFPGHSFKFAAALQAAQGGPAPVLLRVDVRAGHGLGKPTAKLIEESADVWAFVIRALRDRRED
jgi:prolyl oligopeptidase